MKLYINSDLYRYLDRCWPLMPAEWSVAAASADFVKVELAPENQDELLRYMNMDLRYSESEDDERGRMLSHGMYAFVCAQIEMQDADGMSFQQPMG